jgi:hypothetical protein
LLSSMTASSRRSVSLRGTRRKPCLCLGKSPRAERPRNRKVFRVFGFGFAALMREMVGGFCSALVGRSHPHCVSAHPLTHNRLTVAGGMRISGKNRSSRFECGKFRSRANRASGSGCTPPGRGMVGEGDGVGSAVGPRVNPTAHDSTPQKKSGRLNAQVSHPMS